MLETFKTCVRVKNLLTISSKLLIRSMMKIVKCTHIARGADDCTVKRRKGKAGKRTPFNN